MGSADKRNPWKIDWLHEPYGAGYMREQWELMEQEQRYLKAMRDRTYAVAYKASTTSSGTASVINGNLNALNAKFVAPIEAGWYTDAEIFGPKLAEKASVPKTESNLAWLNRRVAEMRVRL